MPAKAKKADDADITFEDAAEKLEAIVEAMESEELPLEKLLVQYEEGTKLVKVCESKLQAAEKRISQLEENLEGDQRTGARQKIDGTAAGRIGGGSAVGIDRHAGQDGWAFGAESWRGRIDYRHAQGLYHAKR